MLVQTHDFAKALDALPVPNGTTHVYNPLVYMSTAHNAYLSRYLSGDTGGIARRPYLILGMNPGPWGMVQTGVPFGDVPNAHHLIGTARGASTPAVSAIPTGESFPQHFKPRLESVRLHPRRPIQGFTCKRVEDSGDRLWAGLRTIWASTLPDDTHLAAIADRMTTVLADCFAMNYCPLAYFTGDNGRNVTPEEFSKAGPTRDLEYAALLDATCGPYLRRVMEGMGTRVVLAIGRYAERKAAVAVAMLPTDRRPKVVYLVHPSPLATSSADAWAEMARKTMADAGVLP